MGTSVDELGARPNLMKRLVFRAPPSPGIFYRSRCGCRRGARAAVLLAALVIYLTPAMPVASNSGFAQNPPVARATASELRGTLPLTDFYDTRKPLPAGKPGELIRSEPFDDYALPPEVSAVRILYHSRAAPGEDVAASGVVLVPEGKPPAGGWPVIAWAHGFSGAARQCAPSLMRGVYYGPFLSMYVNLGYAVVATDYAGLGSDFRNALMDMRSNARDVIYSIPAARAAVPQLGAKWVAMGESLGGLAAVGVAELESEIRDANYLGSIAVSGVADVKDVYEHLSQGPSGGQFALLAYAIKTVYPQFEVGDMLTEKGVPAYQRIQKVCSVTNAGPEVSAGEMLKPNWENNSFVKQFFSRNALGHKTAQGPLLVISGGADSAVPIAMTAQAVARLCKAGDRVEFYKYEGAGPAGLLGDSVRDQISWIQARFAGQPVASNCGEKK
jgi:pimeloyl-ACP methyl ester carboxylesterase